MACRANTKGGSKQRQQADGERERKKERETFREEAGRQAGGGKPNPAHEQREINGGQSSMTPSETRPRLRGRKPHTSMLPRAPVQACDRRQDFFTTDLFTPFSRAIYNRRGNDVYESQSDKNTAVPVCGHSSDEADGTHGSLVEVSSEPAHLPPRRGRARGSHPGIHRRRTYRRRLSCCSRPC